MFIFYLFLLSRFINFWYNPFCFLRITTVKSKLTTREKKTYLATFVLELQPRKVINTFKYKSYFLQYIQDCKYVSYNFIIGTFFFISYLKNIYLTQVLSTCIQAISVHHKISCCLPVCFNLSNDERHKMRQIQRCCCMGYKQLEKMN